eukprot:Skav203216  [mRNA]  locus=scaffold2292:19037:21656:+ [translate_table: standard]
MLDKTSNQSCLTWSNGEWQLSQCQGTPDSSAKFTQRSNKDEALTKGTFCTSRGKQCLHVKECAELIAGVPWSSGVAVAT